MADSLDWLDTLSSTLGNVAGQAVQAAGNVATAQLQQAQYRATLPDQSAVPATSPLQTAGTGITINPVWAVAGVAAVVLLIVLVRR